MSSPSITATITTIAYVDLTKDELNALSKLIDKIANGGVSLMWKRKELEEMGKPLANVHPLKFIHAIVIDKTMKGHLKSIWEDSFKQPEFLGGLQPRLENEAKAGKLIEYADEFAKSIQKDGELIKKHFCLMDWDKFFTYLIES
jgi:hypothetical protein